MNIVSIYRTFPNDEACMEHLETVRWSSKPICPYCKSSRSTSMPKQLRHHCNNCNTSYSVTVGTIFHDTKLDMQKWFLAISLILNAKKGLSARQLARDIEVNKNTAWSMGMRIRKALAQKEGEFLSGIVEMDEVYIGGKPRKGDGIKHKRGRGTRKIPVVGMVERGGNVKAKVRTKAQLKSKPLALLIRGNVDVENTRLMTDEYSGYFRMSAIVKQHDVINHQDWYVQGDIHTNTIESFWAILKRGLIGQYHKVSLRYLPKYVDEFVFRYNYRKFKTAVPFAKLLQLAVGA